LKTIENYNINNINESEDNFKNYYINKPTVEGSYKFESSNNFLQNQIKQNKDILFQKNNKGFINVNSHIISLNPQAKEEGQGFQENYIKNSLIQINEEKHDNLNSIQFLDRNFSLSNLSKNHCSNKNFNYNLEKNVFPSRLPSQDDLTRFRIQNSTEIFNNNNKYNTSDKTIYRDLFDLNGNKIIQNNNNQSNHNVNEKINLFNCEGININDEQKSFNLNRNLLNLENTEIIKKEIQDLLIQNSNIFAQTQKNKLLLSLPMKSENSGINNIFKKDENLSPSKIQLDKEYKNEFLKPLEINNLTNDLNILDRNEPKFLGKKKNLKQFNSGINDNKKKDCKDIKSSDNKRITRNNAKHIDNLMQYLKNHSPAFNIIGNYRSNLRKKSIKKKIKKKIQK